jgi:DNA repair exonuclease SbcCD ATPase subunit
MIKFTCIKYKNFLSSGNHFTSIPLDKHSNTLIIGSNGAGKSSILDALTFSLFGKAFRKINKPQLVNSTNDKDCLTEIEFTISNTDWKVRRGIKPAIFEIYRNGDLLDQESSSRDQQTWLEQNVLKMNYKSFTQIVILGSASFVPFMQLTSQNRREVIEDLLDIGVFSNMNAIVKDKLKDEKDQVKQLNLKKQTIEEKEEMQKNFIAEMERLSADNITTNKNKIVDLQKEAEGYVNDNSGIQKLVDALVEDQKDFLNVSEKIQKLNTFKGQIRQKAITLQEEHTFFKDNWGTQEGIRRPGERHQVREGKRASI